MGPFVLDGQVHGGVVEEPGCLHHIVLIHGGRTVRRLIRGKGIRTVFGPGLVGAFDRLEFGVIPDPVGPDASDQENRHREDEETGSGPHEEALGAWGRGGIVLLRWSDVYPLRSGMIEYVPQMSSQGPAARGIAVSRLRLRGETADIASFGTGTTNLHPTEGRGEASCSEAYGGKQDEEYSPVRVSIVS